MKVWNIFLELMRSLYKKRYVKGSKLSRRLGQVLIDLQMSHVSMRKRKKKDILIYWEYCENVTPELCQPAKVLLAVPATQLCVGRAFPVLRFIISLETWTMTEGVLDFISVKQSALKKLFIWQHKKVLGKFLSFKSENKQMVKKQ